MVHLFGSTGSIVLLAILLLTGGCSGPTEEADGSGTADPMETKPEAVSLLGEPLYAHADVSGFIANADQALAADPNNLDLILRVAEIHASAWHYKGAIELYGRAIELVPDDYRPFRFRGHRYISTRQFDEAIADLEKARELGSYSSDVAIFLGLVYYLQGRFEDAAAEYHRCLTMGDDPMPEDLAESDDSFESCFHVREQVSAQVALSDWAYRALRRAGKHEDAQALLETIDPDKVPETNVPYYLSLLFYKGLQTEEQVLSPLNIEEHGYATLAYGIANWYWVEGEEEKALELLNQIVKGRHWPGFGRIAAEADLARLKDAENKN